jgi:hypothetical protein
VAAVGVLAAAGSALAAHVQMVATPTVVQPGGVVRVSTRSSPCPPGDQVTLISRAFRGHAFGGEGAVYGRVHSHGAFSVATRIQARLSAGRYQATARCGGGNLGVSAWFTVATRVRLVATPTVVNPGGTVRISAASSPCLAADQIILISRAFRGHAYGEGAVYGRVHSHGAFSVTTRIRAPLPAGRYQVTGRCGGGNLGVSAFFRVR